MFKDRVHIVLSVDIGDDDTLLRKVLMFVETKLNVEANRDEVFLPEPNEVIIKFKKDLPLDARARLDGSHFGGFDPKASKIQRVEVKLKPEHVALPPELATTGGQASAPQIIREASVEAGATSVPALVVDVQSFSPTSEEFPKPTKRQTFKESAPAFRESSPVFREISPAFSSASNSFASAALTPCDVEAMLLELEEDLQANHLGKNGSESAHAVAATNSPPPSTVNEVPIFDNPIENEFRLCGIPRTARAKDVLAELERFGRINPAHFTLVEQKDGKTLVAFFRFLNGESTLKLLRSIGTLSILGVAPEKLLIARTLSAWEYLAKAPKASELSLQLADLFENEVQFVMIPESIKAEDVKHCLLDFGDFDHELGFEYRLNPVSSPTRRCSVNVRFLHRDSADRALVTCAALGLLGCKPGVVRAKLTREAEVARRFLQMTARVPCIEEEPFQYKGFYPYPEVFIAGINDRISVAEFKDAVSQYGQIVKAEFKPEGHIGTVLYKTWDSVEHLPNKLHGWLGVGTEVEVVRLSNYALRSLAVEITGIPPNISPKIIHDTISSFGVAIRSPPGVLILPSKDGLSESALVPFGTPQEVVRVLRRCEALKIGGKQVKVVVADALDWKQYEGKKVEPQERVREPPVASKADRPQLRSFPHILQLRNVDKATANVIRLSPSATIDCPPSATLSTWLAGNKIYIELPSTQEADRMLQRRSLLVNGRCIYLSRWPPRDPCALIIALDYFAAQFSTEKIREYLEEHVGNKITSFRLAHDGQFALATFLFPIADMRKLKTSIRARPLGDRRSLSIYGARYPDAIRLRNLPSLCDAKMVKAAIETELGRSDSAQIIHVIPSALTAKEALVIFDDYYVVRSFGKSLRIGDAKVDVDVFHDELERFVYSK